MPTSRWRDTVRASRRLATFAHPDRQDQAKGDEERREDQHGLHRLRNGAAFGTIVMPAVRRSTLPSMRCESQAISCACATLAKCRAATGR